MIKPHHITQEEFELIEQYILEQMPEDAARAFTEKLATDQQLQQKTATVRREILAIEESGLTALLPGFHGQILRQAPERKLNFKILLAAASVVSLLVISLFLIFRNGKSDKLFAHYYRPDPGLISVMSISENYAFDHAMIDYKTKNYDSAIGSWKQLLAGNPASDTLNYFVASAFLAKDSNDSAIYYFSKVLPNMHSVFLDDTYWYLGLASLKGKRTHDAILYLQKTTHDGKAMLLSDLKK